MFVPRKIRLVTAYAITALAALLATGLLPGCKNAAPPEAYRAAIAVNQTYLRNGGGAVTMAAFERERAQWAAEHPGQPDELRTTVLNEHAQVLRMNDAAARELASQEPTPPPTPAAPTPTP